MGFFSLILCSVFWERSYCKAPKSSGHLPGGKKTGASRAVVACMRPSDMVGGSTDRQTQIAVECKLSSRYHHDEGTTPLWF